MMTEDSFVDFKCPYCREVASFPKEYAGLVQDCPNCSQSLIVPESGSEIGKPIPIPITTPRLALRRLQGTDWKDLLECLSEEELFRYREGRPMDEEEISRWLESDSHVKLTTPEQPFYLGIVLSEKNQLIGYLSLRYTDPQRLQSMIDIIINRKLQRQGYATEAVAAMMDFCFTGIGLHRLTAHCDSRNIAACRLFEKCEMRREGEFVQDRFLNGAWVNTVWFARLKEEFTARKA